MQAAFAGQDVVVSAIGPGGTLAQLAMIDAAVSAGVKRFIPSEFGPPHAQARLAELEFAAAPRKTVFKHLQEAAQRSAAVAGGEAFTYSALATGLPFEFVCTYANACMPVMGGGLLLTGGGWSRHSKSIPLVLVSIFLRALRTLSTLGMSPSPLHVCVLSRKASSASCSALLRRRIAS